MNPRKDETPKVAPRGFLENKANAVAFNNNHGADRDTENAFAQAPADTVGLSPTARALLPLVSRVRTDKTAVKVEDGSSRWTPEPLTAERLERHVNGGPARGVCPIKAGEDVTMVGLLDLDSHKGETAWPEMLRRAGEVVDALRLWGYAPVAFRSSGGRGIHIYLLWDAPQDAYSVRRALTDVIESCGYVDAAGAGGVASSCIEVFPKQDSVSLTGFGNQFILPLAGKSELLDLELGLAMGQDAAIGMTWPMSHPVPVLQRPERKAAVAGDTAESFAKVRAALMSIPNDGRDETHGYDWWWPLMCAVHEALDGSDDAYDLCVEWSEQNSRFNEAEFKDRIWPYIDAKRQSGFTRATLYKEARGHGWGLTAAPNAEGFEEVPDLVRRTVVGTAEASLELPAFLRNSKGDIFATIGNLLMACRRPDVIGWRIGHDTFRDELMVATPGTAQWRPCTDEDQVLMREYLEREGFMPIGKDLMRDAVSTAARDHAFDSAQLWLEPLQWDGVSRIEQFLPTYAGTADTPFTRAASLYLWTALAGRVLQPGVKADMVVILVGPQGVRKSSLVASLVPSPEFCVEIAFDEKDDDLARKMRGRLVAEIGELRGMRVREIESVKAFISRTHENWVPKFKEFATTYPRRTVFVGTTNADEFLTDDTGNRRWLPVRVEALCDPDAVAQDLLQLWAEAAAMFRAHGVLWQDAEKLARGEVDAFVEIDPWGPRIEAWLHDGGRMDPSDALNYFDASAGFTTHDVARHALGITARDFGRASEIRIGRVLKDLNCSRQRERREGGARAYVYRLPAASVPTVPIASP